MKIGFFNVVWQSLKERKPEEKNQGKAWALLKFVLRVSVFVLNVLKFFFDEGDSA